MTTPPPHILLCAGEGCGPELLQEAKRLLGWLEIGGGLTFQMEDGAAGEAATLAKAQQVDAVLLAGADQALHNAMGLYALVHPVHVYDPLITHSALRPEIVRGLDFLMVRGRTSALEPAARVALSLARGRSCTLTIVIPVGAEAEAWPTALSTLRRETFPDVALTFIEAEACAQQLLRRPRQFDVLLAYGAEAALLSSQAAMLTGTPALLPTASMGLSAEGRTTALYQPLYAAPSALAGHGLANPTALLLALAMMLRHSFGKATEAEMIETAVKNVLDSGIRTADIMAPDCTEVTTKQMGEAILTRLIQRQ